MPKGGYPYGFMVDTHTTTPPPLPPRLSQSEGRRRAGPVQTLLVMLVSLALCGIAIEACFIYHLYRSKPDTPTSPSEQIAGHSVTSPTISPRPFLLPTKPVAHLTDGGDAVHGHHIMAWSMNAEPLLHEMGYQDKSLVIQKDGYYFVYSKVSFFETDGYVHSINQKTERYPGKSIPLLMSTKYSEECSDLRSNSYLGGVFYLSKDDAILVKVSNTSFIARHRSFENVFGAFMI